MRTSQARQVGLRFLAVTLATLAGAVWITWKYELSMPATVVALLPTLGASYMTWAQFRVARQEATDQLTLGQVADQLAVAVQKQWEAEARHRWLYDPHPLPVAWQPAEPSLVEGWRDLITTATGWPGGPPTSPASWATGSARLAGSGNDLADTLARVPTGRLVVLGEPGAGKTMLLIRLLLRLLARRVAGGPVPVLVGLAGWNPIDHDLTTWLTSRLTRDHPGLAEPAPPAAGAASRVQALVDHRLLLLILDGLDELPQPMLAQAISRLNDALSLGQGVVVASRLAAYRTATTPATAGTLSQTTTAPVPASVVPAVPVRLRGAAGITLQPLAPVDVGAYLCRDAADPTAAARWSPVLAALGTGVPVARALDSPLLVALARTIYNPRPGEHTARLPDPAELCDQTRLPSRAAVQAHLFDAFIPAAYRPHPNPAHRGRWTAGQAERWLGFLARQLHHRNTTDIAWWQLRHAVEWPLLGLVGGVVFGLALGLVGGLAFGSRGGLVGGLVSGLVTGLWAGFLGWRRAPKAAASDKVPARRLPWSIRRLVVGLVGGLAVGLALGLVGRDVVGLRGGLVLGLAFGLLGGLVAGLVGVLGGGLVFRLIESSPADLTTAADPQVVLAHDRGAYLAPGLVGGLVFGLMGGLAVGLRGGLVAGLGGGLAAGLVGWLLFGLGGGFSQFAWGWFVITRYWLGMRGRLPWRLMTFLADAHQRGVLRQVGAVYQFRHVELQRHLATWPS